MPAAASRTAITPVKAKVSLMRSGMRAQPATMSTPHGGERAEWPRLATRPPDANSHPWIVVGSSPAVSGTAPTESKRAVRSPVAVPTAPEP